SGAKVSFARSIFDLIDPAPEVLLWLGEWSVWPSNQHLPLVTRWRPGFGEVRPLIEAPGQLAEPPDLDDAVSILTVALLFVWDCHVITGSGRDALYVSHDEYGWFASRDPTIAATASERL